MAKKDKKVLKVRVPGDFFSGVVYGLKFTDNVSEEITNLNLYERLIMKGYEDASETLPKEKKEDTNNDGESNEGAGA